MAADASNGIDACHAARRTEAHQFGRLQRDAAGVVAQAQAAPHRFVAAAERESDGDARPSARHVAVQGYVRHPAALPRAARDAAFGGSRRHVTWRRVRGPGADTCRSP